jgi:YHS domain-containing protein
MMYRLVIVTALLVIAYLMIRRAYRDFLGGDSRRPLIGKDQMVQDPVCRVYVPRGVAVAAMIGGQEYFFCSPGCAETFQRRLSG